MSVDNSESNEEGLLSIAQLHCSLYPNVTKNQILFSFYFHVHFFKDLIGDLSYL